MPSRLVVGPVELRFLEGLRGLAFGSVLKPCDPAGSPTAKGLSEVVAPGRWQRHDLCVRG